MPRNLPLESDLSMYGPVATIVGRAVLSSASSRRAAPRTPSAPAQTAAATARPRRTFRTSRSGGRRSSYLFGRRDARRSGRPSPCPLPRCSRSRTGSTAFADVRVGAALDRVRDVGRGHLAVDRRAELHVRADVHGDRLAAVADRRAARPPGQGSTLRRVVRREDEQRPLRRVHHLVVEREVRLRPGRDAGSPRARRRSACRPSLPSVRFWPEPSCAGLSVAP